MLSVALVDDHPLIRKILHQELQRQSDFKVIWEAGDPQTMLESLKGQTPDVLILDLSFAGYGFEPVTTVQDLRGRFPRMAILILTAHDDPLWIEELLQAGVLGYVVKSDDFSLRLAEGIRAVAQGRTFLSSSAVKGLMSANQKYTLTNRERAILRLAAEGKTNPEIAGILGVANGTVRNHISNIYAKLDVNSREAAIRAAQNLRELPKSDANIRHELRTPLHTLMGLVHLLQTRLTRRGQLSVDDAEELITQILNEATRLNQLIDELDL